MNQQLTENEISKMLDNLNYPSQADIMQQQLFFIQTETIRKQRINDERIVEALMNIAANNPNGSARKEASKTLKYLGITPPVKNEAPLTKKEAVKIGVMIGLVPTILVCIIFSLWLNILYGLLFAVGTLSPLAMIGGMAGGLIGYQQKKRSTVQGGAILGTILISILLFVLLKLGSPFIQIICLLGCP